MGRSILDAIGNTPLVEIQKLNPNPRVKMCAKLEYFNPGGSIKDRAALWMIEAAERSGELTPQKIVIEPTSGNTGIGLALVCTVKGYRLLLVMSDAVSIERQKILKARGAEILLTPGHLGTDGAIEEAYRLARENPDTYYLPDQFNNEANWLAHYHGTAEEIWQQTNGQISVFVATLGTTGTLMGVSKKLKTYNPGIQIIGIEPYLGHKIQGLKNMKEAYCPEIFEKERLDQKINVDDETAYEMARRLAREEGIFVGMSSGAAMAGACKVAENMTEGTLVVIFPDSGERYLSTSLFAMQEEISLKLFNTLSRKKEVFEPQVPGKVQVYSCGPTAHARAHLGEMRRIVFADLLCRYLEFRGYTVHHLTDINDLDDKAISGSEKLGVDLGAFTEANIAQFKKDLAVLEVTPANVYAQASKHVDDMVALGEKLVQKGVAYEKLRSLYFDISRLDGYGQLSGIDINKIKVGATVDLDDYEKLNPRDFTLFKRSRLSELKRGLFVKTQWGNARPSWHIKSAAISLKYLGEGFDLHTSSRELVFPHHENENAIAVALTGKPLARFFVHCDRVLMDGKKLDKKASGLTIAELVNMGYSGRIIRFWLLSSHYRKPIPFSKVRLADAGRALERLDRCISNLRCVKHGDAYADIEQLLYDLKNGFVSAMDDDLNISAALAAIFTIVKKVNTLILNKQLTSTDAAKIVDGFRSIDTVLKVFNFFDAYADPDIQRLLKERESARAAAKWDLADKIRDELKSRGIPVQDQS
ncbi:MAG: cysteine--tRNA ligase [Desulfobacterales bacterium]|jgi:cysteinyl-tRNA synthetase